MTVPGSRVEAMHDVIEFRSFESRADASAAAAELLASRIRNALAPTDDAQASLVVSGGTTPGPCFDLLSAERLDWSRVTVLPSDERWVTADDPDSNERLIRERLLQGRAEEGNVLSFFREDVDAAQAPPLIERLALLVLRCIPPPLPPPCFIRCACRSPTLKNAVRTIDKTMQEYFFITNKF